jgi:ketol-acid reductoisomerase
VGSNSIRLGFLIGIEEFAVGTRGRRVINIDEIQNIYRETTQGVFAKEWQLEYMAGMPVINRMRRTEEESLIERCGEQARKTIK